MDNGHATASTDQLRALVREVLAEVAGSQAAVRRAGPAPGGQQTAPPGTSAHGARPIQEMPSRSVEAGSLAGESPEAWTVRIETDEDLHAFALRVLRLADNPKLRRDLIGGRIRFALAGRVAGSASIVHTIEKGAVTERAVAAAAKAGARLVLGPRAVLTPLARDKARALGVPIERPRGGWSGTRAPDSTERPRGGWSGTRAPDSTVRER